MVSQIDVVIPCYNYARFLRRCVNSVLSQSAVNVRVLVIDDCSTDNTPEVGRVLAARDSRISYRRHEVNLGHIATYNEGLLEWANAEYSLLLSADDWLAHGALKRITDLMNQYPDVGMAYGMAEVRTDEQEARTMPKPVPNDFRVLTGTEFLEQCFEQSYCLISAPTAVVRTRVQQRVGGYCADLPHSGDVEMWMRFGFVSSIGVLRAVQAYYRWHGSNMGSKYYSQRIGDQREFAQACSHSLQRWGGDHPRSAHWRERILSKLANESFWEGSKALDRGDATECEAWIDFARQCSPAIEDTAAWRRMRVKQAIGAGVWRSVSPILNAMRGIPATSQSDPGAAPFRAGQLVGWWPG